MVFGLFSRDRRPAKHRRAVSVRHRRHLFFEGLEDRRLLAAGWYNAGLPTDVNDDGETTPLDALIIINKLEADGSIELPDLQAGESADAYYDSSNDGFVTPIDVLLVVNAIDPLLIKETTAEETTEVETKSVSSTLEQSESQEHSNTNSNTQGANASLTVGTEYEVEASITGPKGTFTNSVPRSQAPPGNALSWRLRL